MTRDPHPRPNRPPTRRPPRPAARRLAALAVLLLALTACSSPGGPAPTPVDGDRAPSPTRWQPRPGTPWQWQLSGTLDRSVDVPVYDIDGFENGADAVRALHTDGRKVICYINAGAWESFRPDADDFPASVRGKGDGWDGERWLDIRRVDVLRPLMAARFDMCRKKGFDAVEPDLLEGYANTTGFPLTARQQLAYNRMIAGLAHDRGLAVGLKNDLDQVPALVADFDFSVDEQCAQYKECESLTPFIAADKAVFHAEYKLTTDQFCPVSRKLRLSSIGKHLALDAWRTAC
ncbi:MULTISPECIES: endo alpha-1,4 polygalactosaminidase [unclassified Streptomyces]|uniref:endo alpha-1,4 polygalactosaminidase n=1 Tax=unclassified Streptomyces TaxID=2593676 RepID=UPI002E27F139|nr:endo alpha-1,4 polygalactosaminidase [Streptomyces sp. NBC_00223]